MAPSHTSLARLLASLGLSPLTGTVTGGTGGGGGAEMGYLEGGRPLTLRDGTSIVVVRLRTDGGGDAQEET